MGISSDFKSLKTWSLKALISTENEGRLIFTVQARKEEYFHLEKVPGGCQPFIDHYSCQHHYPTRFTHLLTNTTVNKKKKKNRTHCFLVYESVPKFAISLSIQSLRVRLAHFPTQGHRPEVTQLTTHFGAKHPRGWTHSSFTSHFVKRVLKLTSVFKHVQFHHFIVNIHVMEKVFCHCTVRTGCFGENHHTIIRNGLLK